jgi:UDP-N-acetylmuramate--alanine ligase
MTCHFIGLGGIGMSALARIVLQRKGRVRGSDRKQSALLDELEHEGACIQLGHSDEFLQHGDTVIYSTDIQADNVELQKAKQLNLPLLHRSEFLNLLVGSQKPLLVTGTHGKTTTTALLSAVLMQAGLDPSFVIGGLIRPLNTNGRSGTGPFFVAEADESDGSFLKTQAYGAIVTNLEPEHMNYWISKDRLVQGFCRFFDQANSSDHLFWCLDDPELSVLSPRGISYGFSPLSKCCIRRMRPTEFGLSMDLDFLGKSYSRIDLSLYGRHNALNGAAVFGLCLTLGINEDALRKAFQSFGGVARRLERLIFCRGIEVFDDYGHHPTEIKATLSALRSRIGKRRIVVLFQPHRFSRVRELLNDFASCFTEADELIMTEIYSAGEKPLVGVSSEALYHQVQKVWGAHAQFVLRSELVEQTVSQLVEGDVVVAFGAGDITYAAREIASMLEEVGR